MEEELVHVCLPSLGEDDPLHLKKMTVLSARNLSSKFQLKSTSTKNKLLIGFDRLVKCARILLLDELEIYFLEDRGE